jgi:predicted amidohydrolase YtcJ
VQKPGTQPIRDVAFDPSLWTDDIAVINANIITLDPSNPRAQAVLVRRGRIAAVGAQTKKFSQRPDWM